LLFILGKVCESESMKYLMSLFDPFLKQKKEYGIVTINEQEGLQKSIETNTLMKLFGTVAN